MANESVELPVTPEVTKSPGVEKRRHLADKASPGTSVEKTIPNYLRASTGSCHDFCKYGKEHAFDLKERRSIPNRATRKQLHHSLEGSVGGITISVARLSASVDSKLTKMSTGKLKESVDSKMISDTSDTFKQKLATKSFDKRKESGVRNFSLAKVMSSHTSLPTRKQISSIKEVQSPSKSPSKKERTPSNSTSRKVESPSKSTSRKVEAPSKSMVKKMDSPLKPTSNEMGNPSKPISKVKTSSKPTSNVVKTSSPLSSIKGKEAKLSEKRTTSLNLSSARKKQISSMNSSDGDGSQRYNKIKMEKGATSSKAGSKKLMSPQKALLSPRPSLRRVASINSRKLKSLKIASHLKTKPTDSASKPRKQLGEPANDALGTLSLKINQLKKQIQAERIVYIKEKIQSNEKKLQCHTSGVLSAMSTRGSSQTEGDRKTPILSRIDRPLCKFSGFSPVSVDKDHSNQDVLSATSIKIPYIERLPPYTSWIFLDRNQRMAEDQSVVGRRRIYYDQHGSEALICSDSEEESTEHEEEKHEFSEAEDRVLWMAFEEYGLNEEVLNIVSEFVGGTSSEIQERYKSIKEKNIGRLDQPSENSGDCESIIGISPEKSLNAALDSFDNLFCRRCLIFDCRLHGCSQPLVYPSEKQTLWSDPEGDKKPCSDQCYLQLQEVKGVSEDATSASDHNKRTTTIEEADGILAPSTIEEPGNHSTESFPTEVDCHGSLNLNVPISVEKRKVTNLSDTALCDSILPPDGSQNSNKKLKTISDDVITVNSDSSNNLLGACDDSKHTITCAILDKSLKHNSNKLIDSSSTCHTDEQDKSIGDGPKDPTNKTEFKKLSSSMEGKVDGMPGLSDWKPLEKELYLKGVEMFGRNSCLIARNLLSGLKTCVEITSYMHAGGVSMPHGSIVAPSSIMDDKGKFDAEYTDQEMPSRSRLLRKRGKTRKLKYSWKSTGHPSIWKRIADGKNQSCKQYTPCGCQSMCGKECTCVNGGTCCEKYCGCSKSCKNRFRGCHCAKSQCRSRQCPCFAAGRECDPDVCRNCWVSCGDGSLGEPPRRGEGQCGNMRLLLRQQQRILLAKSDVAGWGAFLKNPVNKNDYLGEYTGELISHREADKRGKIYDRANSSFLFDLNDQYVLDAYRKGDKLKFANHSSNPNCYAKVMLVAGDHRVGIFAKEHIDASEELFYDYRYGPDQAPPWARKPEGSKSDESTVYQGRAKKHQSH